MFRRRRVAAELRAPLEGFRVVVAHVEAAKEALTTTIPASRLPGRPLADALLVFEEELRAARERMADWRHPGLDEEWKRARRGLETALAMAERVRLEAPDPAGFEGLVGLVGDLMAPLEAFEAGAMRFRDRRGQPGAGRERHGE